MAFRRATEDFAARDHSAAMAIDGITDTGWSVNGQIGRPHAAVFELKDALGDGRDTVHSRDDASGVHPPDDDRPVSPVGDDRPWP